MLTFIVLVLLSVTSDASNFPDAKSACNAFNLTQKIGLMHGFGWGSNDPKFHGYSRNSGCGGACGASGYFRWDNGPQGFADNGGAGLSTQWPSTLNMAATFDPILASRWGNAMGEEFFNKGTNIQEGPGANIARIEKNGRTFEYISGEDPVLGRSLAVPLLRGQQQHVMAIGKHYMLNNQETDRSGVNEVVDEKTMMELYFPAFESMAPYVAGYMCAYNRINNHYACENEQTLNTMLKGYANFTGFVVSDWGATHSTSAAINAGLDIDMPDPKFFSEDLIKAAISSGNVTESQIHSTCLRIMSQWYKLPIEKRYPCGGKACLHNNVSTSENKELARELAAKSTVLLKNDNDLLPLKPTNNNILNVVLIGIGASSKAYTAGQGSGGVPNSPQQVSAFDAFKLIPNVEVTYYDGSNLTEVTTAAKNSDVTIVFGSAHSGEGSDRKDLLFHDDFPFDSTSPKTEDVIISVSRVQAKTIVVAVAPGQILTDWRHSVPSILCMFLPGEQIGNAIADIIFGKITPQGKLPVTFPNVPNEQKMSIEQWPGVPSTQFPGHKHVVYSEGQIVGYRWYDKHSIQPAFPFGHGLTYGTAGKYTNLTVNEREIAFDVDVDGCDTPQVYIGFPNAKLNKMTPKKVLRYFKKVCNDVQRLRFMLTNRDLSEWDVEQKKWKVVNGTFSVYVGSSSKDIRLSLEFLVG